MKLARKHTRFITRDLPKLVQSAVGRLVERWHHQEERLRTYQRSALEDHAAHDLVIRACMWACPNQLIPRVLRESQHEEFRPHTVWSLFNGFTER